jgi:alpha-glucosidase
VDAIWISPFFTSPMKDFGYDVSTTATSIRCSARWRFRRADRRAHALGLKVMIDLVLSHTSDQHPWFSKAGRAATTPRRLVCLGRPKPDGTPPNNWLSIFGGPAWEWDASALQYYLHNFLTSQPDLNFHNPEVQDALLDIARFWLERGWTASGSTPSTSISTTRELRDNPPLPPEAAQRFHRARGEPLQLAGPSHDKNQPENLAFLRGCAR